MSKPDNSAQKRWKAVQVDYDYMLAQSDEKCTICISLRSVQLILPQLMMLRWPTRYFSYLDTPIDEDKINAWISRAECELMGSCDDQQLPVMRRVDPVTGYIAQISYDAGGTWITDPNSASLTATALAPPVAAGTTATKCDAASNGLQHIKDLIAEQSTQLSSGAAITAVALAIAEFLIGLMLGPEVAVPALISVIIAVIGAIATLDAGIFAAYWTSDVYDKILCALFCHMQDDGSFTPSGQISAINEMEATLPEGTPRDWLIQVLFSIGVIGLNNFCAYGSSSDADCSSCECNGCANKFQLFETVGTNVHYGTDEGGDYVTADSVNDSRYGGQAIYLRTNADGNCCRLMAHTETVGVNPLWCDCNTPRAEPGVFGFGHSGTWPNTDTEINALAANGSAGGVAFSVKWYFAS